MDAFKWLECDSKNLIKHQGAIYAHQTKSENQ